MAATTKKNYFFQKAKQALGGRSIAASARFVAQRARFVAQRARFVAQRARFVALGVGSAALGVGSAALVACHSGGDAVGAVKAEEAVAPVSVVVPTITTPAKSPYYSSTSQLVVAGQCMTNSTVQLVDTTGLNLKSTICEGSAYSFTVGAVVDGFYSYLVTQIDAKGFSSVPAVLVWARKTSVSSPVILTPSTTPYASAAAQITIAGGCETGSTISLGGDGIGSVVCSNSQFSLIQPKAADGHYVIDVVQTDLAGNAATRSLTWDKQVLAVTPPSGVILPVNTPQVFSFSGGSGSYTVAVTSSPSGGSYDPATKTYTTGTLANVSDQLTLTDSLGTSLAFTISTIAGAVDHFSYAFSGATDISGNFQSGLALQPLAQPLVAVVVDRYENPISHYPVFSQVIKGDDALTTPVLQFSNLAGVVQMNVRAGVSHRFNSVQLLPVAGGLPDLAGTGRTRLNFDLITDALGHGQIGSTFKLGQNPNGFVVGDFNEDGLLDVITLNSGEPSLGVLLGYGTGTGLSAKTTACSPR